jgi:hypothetical protein
MPWAVTPRLLPKAIAQILNGFRHLHSLPWLNEIDLQWRLKSGGVGYHHKKPHVWP